MLKRNLALLVLAAVMVGGGAYAWAQTSDTSPSAPSTASGGAAPNRAAAMQQCLQQNGVTDPKSATPEQRKAVRQCLLQNGFKRGRNGPGPGVLGRVVHGDLIVRGKDGAFENVTYDRGKQDSHKGDTLTITRPDNKKVSVTLTSDTKFKGVKDASGLQDGRETVVMSKEGKALTVGQRAGNAPQPANPQATPSVSQT